MKNKVYIIILNHNNWQDTIECCESILKSDYLNFKIIIVDNSDDYVSIDNIKKWAKGEINHVFNSKKTDDLDYTLYPKPINFLYLNEQEIENISYKVDLKTKLILIKSEKNKGFSAGNNLGILYGLKHDDFDYIWILNNDTIIKKDSLRLLIENYEKKKKEKIGILGTIQLYYDNPDIIQAAAGRFSKFKGAFLNYGQNEKKDNFKLKKFEYVYGASFMLSKEFIKKVGLLNEDYFMYYEEIDLAERAKIYGYKIDVAENVYIYHKFAQTTSKMESEFRQYYLHRNKILFYKKFYKKYLPFLFLSQLKDFIFEKNKKNFLKAVLDGYFNKGINKKKKILLLEYNYFHEEMLHPLVELLKLKYEIYLWINEKIYKKNLINLKENINLIKSNKILKFLSIFFLLFFLKMKKINFIIFNTWDDRYVRIINNLCGKNIIKAGILHNADKLTDKEKNKNYIVLSQLIYKNLKEKFTDYNIIYIYPIIYNYNIQIQENNNVENNKIKICIPGKVEFTRRDYIFLIEFLKRNNLKNIRFIILGNIKSKDGQILYKNIKDNKLENYFELFDEFIDYEIYFRKIIQSDIIMPLIHPGIQNYEKYQTNKITAAFNMAYSFKKPLLLFNQFSKYDEFTDFSVFYNFDNLAKILCSENLFKLIKEKVNNIEKCQKFDYFYQQKKLLTYIEREVK